MKSADIVEVFVSSVDETIFKKWRHEGFVGGFSSCEANFVIDGKEYVLRLSEVSDGEHWSERMDGDGNE